MNGKGHPENNGYIGIRDIAKLVGISIATVFYAISNPEMTSEKVGKRVQEVIEEYNYILNQPVKKIFPETSNTIAVLIYDMENPFLINLIKELNQICLEHNYMLLICDTRSDPELEKKYLCLCLANRCAGTILTEGVDSGIFETCRIHIPIAFLDRETHDKSSSVRFNNRQMMQPIVDCLYNLGHREIASIGCKAPMDSVIFRQNGYIETMAGKGLPTIQEYIYDRDPQLTLQAGSRALSYFLSLPAAPTAIICCNDIITLGALNTACSLGLKIPADISTVGFDDVINSLHQPQITTVQQNLRDISLELFELVVNPLEEPISKITEASFIEGATCSGIGTPQKQILMPGNHPKKRKLYGMLLWMVFRSNFGQTILNQ